MHPVHPLATPMTCFILLQRAIVSDAQTRIGHYLCVIPGHWVEHDLLSELLPTHGEPLY